MRKALQEIGFEKAARFGLGIVQSLVLGWTLVPPIRHVFMRLFGAKVGDACIIHDVKFFNLYRKGFAGFDVGDSVFIGEDCLFDLAEGIRMEDHVTLAERVVILTHTNVGYEDHPLQQFFPTMQAPVTLLRGSFLGAGVKVMPGVTIGPEAFVATGAIVTEDVGYRELVAGVPARHIRKISADEEKTIRTRERD